MRTRKYLLVISLAIITVTAFAQTPTNSNIRQLRFFPVVTASDTSATTANNGRVWFDHVSQKLRGIKNATAYTIGEGEGGGTTGPLTINSKTVSYQPVLADGDNNTLIRMNVTGANTLTIPSNGTVAFPIGTTLLIESLGDQTTIAPGGGVTLNSSSGNLLSPADYAPFVIVKIGTNEWDVWNGTPPTANLLTGSLTATRIPFASGANTLTDDSGFLFNSTNDVVTVGSLTALTTTTTPAINLGSFAGDPSILFNGSIWYSSTSNAVRARVNGSSVSLGTSNFTNAATANELIKSNGTNGIVSGLFSSADGNITLGSSAISSGRTINVASSTTSANLTLQAKDNGSSGSIFLRCRSLVWSALDSTNASLNIGYGYLSGSLDTISIASSSKLNSVSRVLHVTSTTGRITGDLLLSSGKGVSSNASTGSVVLQPGLPTGSGTRGSIVLETGNGATGTIKINAGANEQMGTAVLVGGTVTVNNTKITANTRIQLTVETPGGTQGHLSYSKVAATSFTITSTSGTETSTVFWILFEPN
jgi:hypothetical protein